MPEGPEVETIRRDIEPLVVGKTIASTWKSLLSLRSSIDPVFLAGLEGKSVRALGRHGKLMWAEIGEQGFFIRLGMTGRLHVRERNADIEAHTHVRICFEDEQELRYVDPRRFGEFSPLLSAEHKLAELSRLGPDPLSWTDAEKKAVASKIKKSSRSIKNILLDQSVLAGVGNIYASEALFVARISPERMGSQIAKSEMSALLNATQQVMQQAVSHRGTSFMSYVDGWGKKGDNLSRLWVFAREGESCKVCGYVIERLVQSGRSTFWCRRCQCL